MNAQEALNESNKKQTELEAQQMKRVRAGIKEATDRGYYNVMMFESLHESNRTVLIEEGYLVRRDGGRMGENNWLISWGESATVDDKKGDPVYYPASSTPKYPL
jgi:hypothetical protein